MSNALRPLAELAANIAKREHKIIGVLTDIDDTLTTHGKLSTQAFLALQALQTAGLKVVPITGGAASLALHAARLWPVDAAIGESGAVLYSHDGTQPGTQLRTHFWHDEAARKRHAQAREGMFARIKAAVPRAQVARDQCFRLCDLAINLSEDLSDIERLNSDEIAQIKKLLTDAGYAVRQSSIHLNAWLGDYDKLPMTQRALRELWGVDMERDRYQWVYVGDAPNDEAMFEFFPLSVGVANIARHLPQMQHHPAYLTMRESGAGFAELAAVLLQSRQSR
jgi:HAD superfamily hydrolase (TIGR01484 family)